MEALPEPERGSLDQISLLTQMFCYSPLASLFPLQTPPYGFIILSALSIASTMVYIFVTIPTDNLSLIL